MAIQGVSNLVGLPKVLTTENTESTEKSPKKSQRALFLVITRKSMCIIQSRESKAFCREFR